ncbi:SagB/ThcOx family dehydrogenase [Sphaerospermopsis aphanizomenoides BCCUSP55]|uniref:SagB/ThcOx family dehydrogenase n=1 Tax=Sphaerospermopsis aphanizomenoides TaxID=459663 RepID=UPI0019074D90|nr:SagB/ThcOx family dehydrogenase [Sphaerospermopsis aphanizomenoides]MBK1988228.1 SagB/ThcOx family dehydrogenase [Sphaerospermopsis aphanizomenoides BCCUSP55]
MYKVNEPLELALLYHLNSPVPKSYVKRVSATELRYMPEAAFLELPQAPHNNHVSELLERRSSVRSFANKVMPLISLAQLLDAGCGLNGLRHMDGYTYEARNSPSAGGLYPIEIFVSTQAVEGLTAGLYHYEPRGHGLHRVSDAVPTDFIEPFLQQDYIVNANALFFFTSVFMRSMCKYGARGYRFALLEAGHQAENICLMAVQLGLGSLCIGGFNDTDVNTMLGIDGKHHAALYCVAVGTDSSQ